jgi:glycosyltransferase involved in cell wall biosynthesis
MKSVVMIAYFFPPEGSAGSYRPLRFVRQLSKMGWRTSVVTADPYRYERYDPELLSMVPSETQIVRVRGRDPWQALQAWREKRIKETFSKAPTRVAEQMREGQYKPLRSSIRKAVRTVESCYYQPDLAKFWIRPAVRATIETSHDKNANVIWATAGPVSSWVVARRVSQRTGIPYVLDLRDPHGLSFYNADIRQAQWIQRRNRHVMYSLFKDAQSVVFLFDSVAESYCRAFPGALDPKKIHIIPNGYEGKIEEFQTSNASQFTVLYTGTLSSYRYDTLLQALVLLKRTHPDKARLVRFRFVGEGMEDLTKQAAELGLLDVFEGENPRTQAEITRLETESQTLLVLGRLSTIQGHELFAGAKVFNYLKAGRPIFGVLPQDETRKVLLSVGVTTVADVESPLDIARVLRKLLDAWCSGNLASLLPDHIQCEYYSAERQLEALLPALEGRPARHSFVPGTVEIPVSLRAELDSALAYHSPHLVAPSMK